MSGGDPLPTRHPVRQTVADQETEGRLPLIGDNSEALDKPDGWVTLCAGFGYAPDPA